jgi:hypothetical protein
VVLPSTSLKEEGGSPFTYRTRKTSRSDSS